MFFMVEAKLSDKARLVRRSNRAPLIQQIENTQTLIVDQLDHLYIILKGNLSKLVLEAFIDEMLFFQFKDLFKVNLMEALVCVVYEELLQAVDFEDFKSIDIEETQGKKRLGSCSFCWWAGQQVYLIDDPLKQLFIKGFGECMDELLYLSFGKWFYEILSSNLYAIWS